MFDRLDRPAEHYAPYVGHIEAPGEPGVVLLTDGSAMVVLELGGVSFELEGNDDRNARQARINNLIRTVSDDNVLICSHMVKYRLGDEPMWREQSTKFGGRMMDNYHATVLAGQLMRVAWFITVVVRLRDPVARLAGLFIRREKPLRSASQATLRQLEDVVTLMLATLAGYGPRRLGIREVASDIDGQPRAFSEIGEALHLIRTAVHAEIPLVHGSLAASIYTSRVVHGRRAFDLCIPGLTQVGSIISLREYPGRVRPGMFNELLSCPYPAVLSQSFECQLRSSAEAQMTLKHAQMASAGDRAVTLLKGLAQAMDDIASNETASGVHHLSLAVYAPDIRALDRNVADAINRLVHFGNASPTVETDPGGQKSAYWAQLPGVLAHRTRPGKVSSRDFSCMSSFETFPTGAQAGQWGLPVIRFRTRGGTAFDYVTHDGDVGHTMLVGKTGGGKTVFMGFLAVALEQAVGAGGIRICFDKDEGNRISIEMAGGHYLSFHRGKPSGLAPLRAFPNTPENAEFLQRLFVGRIESDGHGPITADDGRRIARGIARQLRLPTEARSMAGVREFMGFETNGAGERFERWCRGGSMGWLLDNDAHRIDLGSSPTRFYGFGLTELLPTEDRDDDGACNVAASVIMHQLRGLMDGRRIAIFADESRFYLDALEGMLEDFALTGRKKELALFIAAQEPAHFLATGVGRSLISQCFTKIIFPNQSAKHEDYVDGLKLTPAAFRQVRGDMTMGAARRFLLWRENSAVVCDFDLSGMRDEIAILSGRAGSNTLLDRVHADLPGADTTTLLDEFQLRHANASRRAA